MKTKRFLALLLSVIMVLSMMPMTAVHVHAEEYTWNPNATMTLKCGDEVVEPKEVIETADTKMKVYQINSISDYTLTTSSDNDYAVFFEVNWSVISEDEYGYKDYDYEMTVTLDNVTIRTYNPRVDQNEKIHAAMTFSDEKCDERYETLNVQLVGDNTVELLGVKNDSLEDRWSAVSFIGPNTVIKGEGTLNATSRYSNAVGAVSALYTENSVGLYDTVTLNATADVKAKKADTLIGDGLYFDDYEFIMEAGTTANIKASGSGIMHGTEHVRAKWLDGMYIDGDLDIRAADYGISWQAGGIYMGDGSNLIIQGLSDVSVPNVGILVRRNVFVGAGCTLKVGALGSAISCRAITTANPSAPLTVGKNSVVELSGSVDSNVFVLDCGTKLAGTNNVVSGNGEEWFGESYPVSELILEEGAKLTINAGYLALRAALMELKNGSELDIRTEKYPESENVEESMAVYISTNRSYVRNGAKLNIEVASDYAIYGFTSLYLESNNVYLKSTDSALYSGLGMYRGTDPVIYTFESDDGISWIPFANKNSKPYFTTKEPATHICAASRTANTYSDKVWTPIESEYKHTAKCIYCAADIVADCQWDRGVWYYSGGVHKLKFECEICERERFSDVEYHSHVFETWTPLMGDYYPMHESTCTVPGCGASTESYCSDSYSEEFHVSMTTLRKNCTKCGRYTEREIDISAVEITHVEAKPAACGEVGNTEFWICGHCNKYFSDESCQHEVTPAQVYISPKEHKYVNNTCSNCGHNIKSARFEQSMDDTFSSDDRYLYVLIGIGSDGKLYAMGEATPDGRRYGVEIPNAQIDENGIITLNSNQAEFMDFEYYFENGSGATTTSTFMVDGNYMTARYGKIYTFPQDRLDDKNNPRPFSFRLESYSGESSLGYVDCDLYDPSDYSHDHEYITFNPETHYFEACEDRQYTVYLYRQVCDHEDIYLTHSTPVAPTCTEQGFSGDFWECTMCYKMFTDKSCSTELVLPDYCYDVIDYYQVDALGHSFNSEGVCENCGMKRNVYKPVTSLEQFDQLSEEAYYIIVFKDSDKTYAAYIPDWNIFNKMITADSDGDGLIDLLETDANANGIPDIVEEYIDTQWGGADENEDGTTTADEYKQAIGSLDDDEDVDVEDYKQFFAWHIEYLLREEFEEKHATNHPNVVEVTVAADGSITIIDEDAMEFQMMPSGIWGGQEYDESELEYEGIKETERLRAAWVPNWWIANYGTMGEYSEDHFLTQNRYFGDRDMPGVIDNKNWKISFNEDGTALLVSTWTTFDDSAALQLVKYTDEFGNERITMVGCYDERWQYSDILSNCTVISGAYLYASEPVYDEPPHECIWGNWKDDDVTDTHTRKCTVEGCDKKQTENHNWDKGVETKAPTCTENGTTTYTCPDCKATKTEPIPALDHDFGDWTYDSVDSHIRHCKRENCNAEDFGGHEWGTWVSVDENTHKMTCSVCNGYQTDEHEFDNGVVTKEPTEWEEGVKTYTCGMCSHTKTEPVDKLIHECTWTDWYPNGDENHKRDCMDDKCDKFETLPHEWDDGVITKEPTCKEKGVKTYTCQVCQHTRTEDVPTTDHVFGDWTPNNDGTTHSRYCSCNESETADHKFDDGEVTQAPTHEAMGERKYTCSDCGYFYTEDIPTLTDHEWGDWVINKLDEANTHIRYCICNESQTAPHNFDDGVITEPATHTSKGIKTFTCTDDCGYTYDEEIPTTPAHEWTDWSPNGDGTHTRACRCNANETKDCEWDDGVITKQPTHFEEGVKTFTCTVCKATKTESIAKTTAHEWGDWAKKDDKSHIRECKCGATETKDHAFDAGTVTKEPTHLETGVKKFTCADCGFVREDVLNKTPEHTFGEWKTEATVVGKHYRECACGEREIGDCTWDAGVVTTEPTYEATGTKTYTCTVCGGTKTETIDMLVKAEEIVSPENSDIKITTPEGSNAVLNENTVLKVEEVKDEVSEDVKANVEIVVGNDNAEVLASYDISLILDGATVQPGGTVEVTLPAPENAADFDTLQVVYIDDDGNVTPCETRVNADGTVTFVTDHFSHYAIVGVQNSSPVVWILISAISVALIAGAVVAVLVIKKEKGIA